MKRLLLSVTAVLLLNVSTTWAGQFEDADEAYRRGDYADSIKVLRHLAVQGDARAQYKLGLQYEFGEGVSQNYSEAAEWYRRAAVLGDEMAQYNLGLLYEKGKGITQNFVRAYSWCNVASLSGNVDAARCLNIAENRMTSQKIVEAQKMARDCQQHNFKGCD